MDFNKCSDETLIDIYRKGDEAAIEVLFERYKDIVRKKAKAMYLAGGDSDDLIQEGMIGLYKAVRDYDDTKEAAFKTFASMCINRQLINAVTAETGLLTALAVSIISVFCSLLITHPRLERISCIINTSSMHGQFSITLIPSLRILAAITGRHMFFEPCTLTLPYNFRPP